MPVNLWPSTYGVFMLFQIFFYIDPEFLDDPSMDNIQTLTLSYTFFRTGESEIQGLEAEVKQDQSNQQKIAEWTQAISEKTGIQVPDSH